MSQDHLGSDVGPPGQGGIEAKTMATSGEQSQFVNLGFLDLLYAVPISDLAVRVSGADLGRVSIADWANLAVCMVVIILSWIGLHQNRAEMVDHSKTHREWISRTDYFSLRFVQFTVEIVIVVFYFALGLKIHLPTSSNSSASTPDMRWLIGTLMVIFGAYLLWDLLDVALASREKPVFLYWRERATKGSIVTAGTTVIFAGFYAMVCITTATPASALTWSLLAIALLYLYRVVQQNQIHRVSDTTKPAA